MFDLRDCSDEDLQAIKTEVGKTRGSPLETVAAIMAVTFGVALKREIERRRKPAGEASKPAGEAAGGVRK